MADTRVWSGSDGDWSVAGNWDPVGVPVNGDSVILNGTNDVAITAGLSQSAVTLALLFIADDFTKDVASAASPLNIEYTKFVHRGKGAVYIDSAAQGAEAIVAHTGDRRNLSWRQRVRLPSRIVVSRGRVELQSDSPAVDDLILAHVDVQETDADVTIAPSSDVVFTRVRIGGGTLDASNSPGSVTNITVCGGLAILNPDVAADPPTIHISQGGTVQWNNSTNSIAEANIYDGLLDLTQSYEEKTVTLANLWPHGEFRFFPDLTTQTTKEWDGKTVDIG
jgi:hypothetical protein